MATVEAVDPDAGEGREEKGGDLAAETYGTEEERRSGEAVDQPSGGDAGHPGADEGDALAADEELEGTMAKGSPGVGVAGLDALFGGGGGFGFRHLLQLSATWNSVGRVWPAAPETMWVKAAALSGGSGPT